MKNKLLVCVSFDVEMSPKDLAVLLILAIVLHGVTLCGSAIMLERFAPMTGGMKGGLVLYAGLSGFGIFLSFFALILKPNGLVCRLNTQVWVLVLQFCVGVLIAGISFNRHRLWMDWRTQRDTAQMPSIVLGVAALVQLGAAFFLIRGKEQVKDWDGPDVALSHLLCSSDFAEHSDDDEYTEFIEDPFYKKKRKPTFHNRVRRARVESSSEEEVPETNGVAPNSRIVGRRIT